MWWEFPVKRDFHDVKSVAFQCKNRRCATRPLLQLRALELLINRAWCQTSFAALNAHLTCLVFFKQATTYVGQDDQAGNCGFSYLGKLVTQNNRDLQLKVAVPNRAAC